MLYLCECVYVELPVCDKNQLVKKKLLYFCVLSIEVTGKY